MSLRRARRRRRQIEESRSLLIRVLQFVTSWEGILSFGVFIVAAVLLQGILRLPMPFDWGKPPPIPDTWGYINVPRGQPLKLAYIGDVSGGASLDAPGAKQAVEMALAESGVVKNTKVELSTIEDSCDPQKATEKAQELVSDLQVVGVISQACTASTLAMKSVLEEARLPLMSLSTHLPALTRSGTLVTFNMAGNVKSQGNKAALYARQDLQVSRALLLQDGSPGAEETLNEFRSQFRPQGGQIVDSLVLNSHPAEWGVVLKEIISLEADFVYVVGKGSVVQGILSFLRQGGYTGNFMVADDAYSDPAYQQAGAILEQTYATTFQVPRAARYAFWKDGYEKDYGVVGPLSPEAYDAATLLLNALNVAAKSKGDGTVEVGRGLLVGLIRSLPYDGLTGPPSFDSNGDRANILVQVMKVEDGQFKQVK